MLKELQGGLDLLTFETFQFFSQVVFIPVFLVFQVFLRMVEREGGCEQEGDQKKKQVLQALLKPL